MKIDIINLTTKLTAEDGLALKRKDNSLGTKTQIKEVWLGPSDSVQQWEDCEYGETSEDIKLI